MGAIERGEATYKENVKYFFAMVYASAFDIQKFSYSEMSKAIDGGLFLARYEKDREKRKWINGEMRRISRQMTIKAVFG